MAWIFASSPHVALAYWNIGAATLPLSTTCWATEQSLQVFVGYEKEWIAPKPSVALSRPWPFETLLDMTKLLKFREFNWWELQKAVEAMIGGAPPGAPTSAEESA